MVFSSVGSASATAISGNVNDSHETVVDNPTIIKIQKAVNGAKDNDIILINGSPTSYKMGDTIHCDKILTIMGKNCTINKLNWECSKNITFKNITFNGNFAECGGAINSKNNVNVENCSFVENSAKGAVVSQCKGGAIYSDGGIVNISNSEFIRNAAEDYGGAIYSKGNIIINGSLFKDNTANDNDGGAIYSEGGIVNITCSEFEGNSAYEDGGAIYSDKNVLIGDLILRLILCLHLI